LQNVTITTLPTHGAQFYNTVSLISGTLPDSIPAADIAAGKLTFTPAANANGSGYATFSFEVQDDGGTSLGGHDTSSAATMTVNENGRAAGRGTEASPGAAEEEKSCRMLTGDIPLTD